MLNNIFPVHTKTQNHHLKYPNVRLHETSNSVKKQKKNKKSDQKATYFDEQHHVDN
jgi:hypothetical protein